LNTNILDVIIVGAGHAGLSTSYFLCKNNLKHIVFERGQIGESWRSQRWDSFTFNTPNHMNTLPGENATGLHPNHFMHRDDFINNLKNFTEGFQLPVQENTTVTSITKNPGEQFFLVTVRQNQRYEQWLSKQVVIATGAMSAPKIPSCSKFLSKNICQLHVSNYRNESKLPQGAVLIIGSGQSGCQVAEDLVVAGRKVYLASSKTGRVPRRYRGTDILDWFIKMKHYDVLTDDITDPRQLMTVTPLLSGVGIQGHTLSLQSLYKQGVAVMGRLKNIINDTFIFAQDAAENVHFADNYSAQIKLEIDLFIAATCNTDRETIEAIDDADQPDLNASCASNITSLICSEKQINTVIWTTGFTSDFSWIKLPVINREGKAIHRNGISPVKGLFFIGFPWLRSRKSGIIYGVAEDAAYLAKQIVKSMNEC
jgi:putative flavoprotein involved in K+ transport